MPLWLTKSLCSPTSEGAAPAAGAEKLLLDACRAMLELEKRSDLNANQQAGKKARLASLVQLYEATGRPEKAAEWRAAGL
ncbi:MAG: hypothetical protein EXS37_05455 [Opitutus sp.]|nr:hypothetical protein [Opitutus sp.]